MTTEIQGAQEISTSEDDFNALLRVDRIEVWDEEWDTLICVAPVHWTIRDVRVAMKFYNEGVKEGERTGAIQKAHEIRKALGL